MDQFSSWEGMGNTGKVIQKVARVNFVLRRSENIRKSVSKIPNVLLNIFEVIKECFFVSCNFKNTKKTPHLPSWKLIYPYILHTAPHYNKMMSEGPQLNRSDDAMTISPNGNNCRAIFVKELLC